MKNFEYQGVWWTEGHSDKVRGTLSFFGRDRAILNLDNDFPSSGEVKMVWGITDTGRPITLVGCVKTGVPLFSLTGFSPAKYKVSEVYVGAHFSEKGEITFRTIYVCFNYLSQWVNISGLRYQEILNDQGQIQSYEISCMHPEAKDVFLPDGSQLSIIFRCNMNADRSAVTLRQTTGISIVASESLSLHRWLNSYLSPLQDLIHLAMLRPNSITELQGKVEPSEEEQDRSGYVDIFFSPIFHDEQEPVILNPEDFLFRFDDVKDCFHDVIVNWFKMKDELGIVRSVFFGTFYQRHTFLDKKFIDIAQAAEIYHRRRYSNNILPKSQWKDLLNRLRSVLSEEEKRWINDRIAFGNEPRLRERVRELLDETDDVLSKLVGDKDAFAKKVTDTRNYFTHYSGGSQGKAIDGELLFLTEVLITMMQRCFLMQLGVPSERCVEMFQRNRWYKYIQEHVHQFSWGFTGLPGEGDSTE
jgi:hypothetical protein